MPPTKGKSTSFTVPIDFNQVNQRFLKFLILVFAGVEPSLITLCFYLAGYVT